MIVLSWDEFGREHAIRPAESAQWEGCLGQKSWKFYHAF
jgi:hypothetical protein